MLTDTFFFFTSRKY